jgi:hypothetical protein
MSLPPILIGANNLRRPEGLIKRSSYALVPFAEVYAIARQHVMRASH